MLRTQQRRENLDIDRAQIVSRVPKSLIFALLLIDLSALLLSTTQMTLEREAHATTVLPLTLGQLTRQSHLIIVGEVTEREVIETVEGSIWTRYQIKVEEQWRGPQVSKEKLLELNLLGGQLGEGITTRGQVVHGQPQLKLHQRGVFFLERTAAGQLVFTGLSQGWFALETRHGGEEWLHRDDVQAHLHQPVIVKTLSTVQHSLNDLPLSQLKHLVIHGAPKARLFNSLKPSDEGSIGRPRMIKRERPLRVIR